MPNVTKQVRLYVSRHRRRRGDSSLVYVYPPFTNVVSGTYHDEATHTVPYDFGDGEQDCPFLFWSITSPAGSRVQTQPRLEEPIGADTTVTAWYAPAGGSGIAGPEIVVDAFDASIGDFVDDDFIDVVSDPSLTSTANLDGVIPTSSAERAVAYATLSGHPGDPFDTWILDTTGASATSAEIDVSASAGGFAFADYRRPVPVTVPDLPRGFDAIWMKIFVGIINDAPGIWVGPDGRIHPWPGPEPFYKELLAAMATYAKASELPSGARQHVQRVAAQAIIEAGRLGLKRAGAGGVSMRLDVEEGSRAGA